jgi:hypothetical protein
MIKKLLDKMGRLLKKKDETRKEKDQATREGKPWVKVVKVEVDPANPSEGYFELDWNDLFVTMLVNAGYVGKNNDEIVDQWFNDLCNGIARQVAEEDKFVADAELLKPKRK